jgi:hypothetical protein
MKKPSILVLSFSDLSRDPRVNRQVRTLAEKFSVTFAGFGAGKDIAVRFVELNVFPNSVTYKLKKAVQLFFRCSEKFYWAQSPVRSALEKFKGEKFDLVVANDIDSLPLALKIANGSPVYFDAHEYHPREFEDRLSWRIFQQPYKKYLCAQYLKSTSVMTTVCQGIADEYKKEYDVDVDVVLNVPDYQEISPSVIESGQIRLVHHGAAISSRNLEEMIDMFEFLDNRFSLDFMLVPSDVRYFADLKKRAERYPKIRFIDPVPMRKIVESINCYDLGVYILPPTSFNNEYALPNKLFEFIQARLGVAIGPSPEMAKIVKDQNIGVVATSFSAWDLAYALNGISLEDVRVMKNNATESAKIFCFDQNAKKILCLAEKALGL